MLNATQAVICFNDYFISKFGDGVVERMPYHVFKWATKAVCDKNDMTRLRLYETACKRFGEKIKRRSYGNWQKKWQKACNYVAVSPHFNAISLDLLRTKSMLTDEGYNRAIAKGEER